MLPMLISCSEENEPEGSIDVAVKYEYENGANDTYPVAAPHSVYLFEEINFATGPYTYIGQGKIKNDNTGEVVNSVQLNKLESGRTKFEGLEIKTYGVVLDMLDTEIEDFTATSINLKTYSGNGELSFTVDIWPYDPWDF